MKKKIKKIALIILPMVIIFVAVGFAINNNKKGDTLGEDIIIKKRVEVQGIIPQDKVSTPLIVSGIIEPKKHTVIRSLTPGTIAYIVPVGERVFVGQPLFGIVDNNIENNFFNSMQNLEQTEILSNQKVNQAELGLNSAEARYNLAEVQYDNAIAKIEQSIRVIEDTAVVSYNSSYNNYNQVLNFLTEGKIDKNNYIYKNILMPDFQFRINTNNLLSPTVGSYYDLAYPLVDKSNLVGSLNNMYSSLLKAKTLIDNTLILLQGAIAEDNFNSAEIEGNKTIVSGYQSQINQHINAILSGINNLENSKINNKLSLNQAKSQLRLAEIDLNNSLITLENAKEGVILEVNMARSQFDGASYSYNNLSIGAPFSGTVISHFFEMGDQVSVGQQVIELGDLSLAEVKVGVNIDFAEAISLGDEVLIEDLYNGIVTEIEPVGDLQSGKVDIVVESDDKNLAKMSGANVEIKLNLHYERAGLIVVPIKSVIVESTGSYVFLLEDNRVVSRAINLGQVFGDKVEVISGINEGEKLILQNGIFIAEGEEVEVIEE
jgi:RND family efflux transporter MFP subunit